MSLKDEYLEKYKELEELGAKLAKELCPFKAGDRIENMITKQVFTVEGVWMVYGDEYVVEVRLPSGWGSTALSQKDVEMFYMMENKR